MERVVRKSWSQLTGAAILMGGLALSIPAGAQSFIMANGASFNSCSGNFFDSGGVGGNYSNNEDLTATLCPQGGAGSGPITSVLFTQWAVETGSSDQLFIYDGTTTAAPLLATGNGANSLLNQTYTATGASGCLTFRWVSNATVVAAGWTAAILTGPDAGLDGSITVCSNAASFDLFAQLGGTPDAGGTWTAPGGASHSNIFNPAVDVGGVYTYTVSGTSPCPNDQATVTVTRVLAPNAGSNGAHTVCSNSPSFNLFNYLGGNPDTGGSWTFMGSPHSATFNPAVDAAGLYTYTVTGTPPCSNASRTVNVSVNTAPDAGSNGSISVCSIDPSFNLFNQLGGTPDGGGTWTAPGGQAHPATFTPGTSTPGNYTYTVAGVAPCANATAVVNVSVTTAPNPGISRSIARCSNDPSFNMTSQLLGTPDAGGTWTFMGNAHSVTFNPAVDVSGVYTYTVPGTAPCGDRSANLTVTVRQAPNAGLSATVTRCSIDPAFQLITVLGGTPDNNGTWTAPGGGAFNGNFIPGSSQSGVYTYTVPGQSPCVAAVSTVTVDVNTAPNAGTSTSITVCSSDPSFSLISKLGGTPDAGGTWTRPNGTPHGATFNPSAHPQGTYTYTVAGQAPCANAVATVQITVNQAPNAGNNASISLCSNDASVVLFSLLTGSPDATGTWQDPNGSAFGGTFDPDIHPVGVYTYTVPGQAPCANDQSTVTVSVTQAPNAGSNGSVTVCSNGPIIQLFDHLTGTPQTGGTWTRPNGTAFSGSYNPAVHPAGVYTYTVAGTGPCANATATVQVIRNIAPKAGTDGTITVCSTSGSFALITVLGGGPDAGGVWTDPNSNAVPSGNFTPGTSIAGQYRYVVTGTAPCANDTSFAQVNVSVAPVAGNNASILVCGNDPSFNLFNLLGGSPDAGGTWKNPNNMPHSNIYVPGTDVPGIYTYTVIGQTPCANATATVLVQQTTPPNAGQNGTATVCSTDPPLSLFAQLGGSPNTGGSWTGPGGVANNGSFVPGTDPQGTYVYTVNGSAPCSNATANVVVTVNAAPNSGGAGSLSVCNDPQNINLFTVLVGAYDAGGTWSDDDNTGQLAGNIFNPNGLAPGNYDFTYLVPGNGNCAASSTTVTVTIVPQLNAGQNTSRSICGNISNYPLISGLTGNPQSGGSWTDTDNTQAVTAGAFNATLVNPGTYHFTYTLTGSTSCANASAILTLTVVAAPNAGQNSTFTTCSNGSSFNMTSKLQGNPQANGSWFGPGPGYPAHGNVYAPATDAGGTYLYVVQGASPCLPDTAVLTVIEVSASNAGQNSSVTVCSNGAAFSMLAQLTGNPQTTGTWTDPNGLPHSNTFVPGSDPPGVYIYTVPGTSPCPNAIAALTVNVNQYPNSGVSSSTTVCSDDAPFLLITYLAGAGTNGTWTGPGGASNGVFTPGISQAGIYTYTIAGVSPCASSSSTVNVFVNNAPDAGISSSISVCSNGANVNLFGQLGGTPDAGGSWTAPNGSAHNGIFQPGTSLSGSYKYKIVGISPCASDSALVNVTVNPAPNAGTNNTHIICSNAPAFTLFSKLGGTPQVGGTWVDPNQQPTTGLFIPGTSLPGTYIYTVTGTPPCTPASASVTIVVNTQANAGNSSSVTVCSTDGQLNLFQQLGGNPQTTGSWSDPNGNSHSATFNPASDQPGNYTYTVTGQSPCGNATAVVTVNVDQARDAGISTVITICSDALPFTLIDQLDGTPDLNGSWTDPNTNAHNGIFLPGTSIAGTYTYTVSGTQACPASSSVVNVIQNQAPDAGTNASITVCSSNASIDLIDVLGGSPDPDGNWTGPNNQPHSGTYIPGTSTPGIYTYTIVGDPPCATSSATVNVSENGAPNAGITSAVQICSDDPPQPLIDLLNGTPDSNGSWSTPGPTPHGPTFDPAIDVSNTYTYTVPGVSPCSSAVASVQITLIPAPDAGSDGVVTVCLDDPSIELFDVLVGDPDLGGSWTDLDNTGQLNNGVLDGTGLVAGEYGFMYTVQGTGTCDDATSVATVTIANDLDAGGDSVAQVCQNETNIFLFALLGGAPQTGGSWIDDDGSGSLNNGVFNASAVAPNTTWNFTYVLNASATCLSDSATVTVQVQQGPFAGSNGFSSLCTNGAPLQLITLLSGANGGGSWFDTNGDPLPSGTFDPASDPPGEYTYVVAGIGGCPADSATATVAVSQAADPGISSSIAVCDSQAPLLLINQLGGTPQSGGSWIGPGNVPHSGTLIPSVDVSGTYTYTVQGTPPCAAASANVVVTVDEFQTAGINGNVTLCSTDAPYTMFGGLTGTPAQGGQWYDPNFIQHGPTFDPQVEAAGVFTYIVGGGGGCTPDSATVNINVQSAPNAGVGSTIDTCGSGIIDLLTLLGGSPDPGGAWVDLDNTGALNGSELNASLLPPGSFDFQYFVQGTAPCPSASSFVTVNLTAGGFAGFDGAPTICGGLDDLDLFDVIVGATDLSGVWTDILGTGALTGSVLDATQLDVGQTYPFSYVVSSPTCGGDTALLDLTISPWLSPGTGVDLNICETDTTFDLFALLGGDPDSSGYWIGPLGNVVVPTYVPGTSKEGAYYYIVQGVPPCFDDTAVVFINESVPVNAGFNAEINSCAGEYFFDLFSWMGPDIYPLGTWVDLDGSGALTGSQFYFDVPPPGVYDFYYIAETPGCTADTAEVTVTVVGGVEIVDLQKFCDEQYRTYTVTFELQGGSPSGYNVQGISGELSAGPPYIFNSDILLHHETPLVIANDNYGCDPFELELTSPCDFETEIFVPQSFSPNNDGINEYFQILGIEGYPQSTIQILNRWGDLIYSATGYNNNDVKWDGSSSNALIPGEAPTGTYFYVIKLDQNIDAFKGFVYLNR